MVLPLTLVKTDRVSMINKKQAVQIAIDIIIEGFEFGEFWQDADEDDFKLVSCDWDSEQQEWIVKIRGCCPEPKNGETWLMSLALHSSGELTGGNYDVEK